MVENRIIAPQKIAGDEELYTGLRPQSLDDFVGQKSLCENLRVFIQAAKKRGDALDHTLLFGPPGLGKTTLAQIISKELLELLKQGHKEIIARIIKDYLSSCE